MSGAYAAANAFLDALATHQRRLTGIDARSIAWSMWDELGMSRGYPMRALTEARGYRVLDEAAGLRSFDLARRLDEPRVLVGADRTAPWVRSHVLAPVRPVHRLDARVALLDGADIGAVHRGAAEAARLLGADDHWVLRAAVSAGAPVAARPPGADPARHRELEDTLAAIWSRALGRDEVGVDENFFDLGGNSLLLVGVQAAVNQQLGCELDVVDLFSHPTVAALARHLAAAAGAAAAPATAGPGQPGQPGGALARARQQAQRRHAARTRTTRTSKGTENDG